MLVAGIAVGDQAPVNEAGSPAATAAFRREAMACRNVSRPSGVRVMSTCGAPAAAFPCFSSGSSSFSSVAPAGRRGPVQHVHRGLVGGQRLLAGQRREHRLIEPAFPSCADTRAAALSTQPAETPAPSSMPMSCAARSGGTFP